MNPSLLDTPWLLGAFGVAAGVSALACAVALALFPWFRSGEKKLGTFRADQSAGGSDRFATRKWGKKVRVVRVSSSELPIVGGPAMILAIVAGCVAAAFFLNLNVQEWTLLAILLAATVGYAFVGFLDDYQKVHRGVGISEAQKFLGIFVVSLAAAIAVNRLVQTSHLNAHFPYPPYSELPVLGSILKHTHFAWIAFFLGMTVLVTSATALAADFSDGMDGLCGGLSLSAALAFAVILMNQSLGMHDVSGIWNGDDLWPLVLAMLAMAGAAAGYLPFNWPSSWRARGPAKGKRRAKLIMGDSGSLALGGLLALVAVLARMELLLLIIGGAFVLEGLSALMQGRILVQVFRRVLFVERFGGKRGFLHTEFPLPFLATPMHHHFDLLNVDRKRLVYGAWLLGAGLGVLGVASTIGEFTWERYLARFVGLLVLVAVWQSGPWTRAFFIGTMPSPTRGDDTHYLALFYGYPFRLLGRPLYRRVDITHVTPDAIEAIPERLLLWQRLGVFDARAVLGYYCYRSGEFEDADRIWGRIPEGNLRVRKDIAELVMDVKMRLADAQNVPAPESVAPAEHSAAPRPGDPMESQVRMPIPGPGGVPISRATGAPMWSATAWTTATTGEGAAPDAPDAATGGHNLPTADTTPTGAAPDANLADLRTFGSPPPVVPVVSPEDASKTEKAGSFPRLTQQG